MRLAPAGPSSQIVREQLERLLQSDDFRASPRLRNILAYIVEETLQGRSGDLKAFSIAVDVLGRGEKFDPSTDPIVRVELGKLRRQLELFYILNPASPVRISIPKGGYAPVFHYESSRGGHNDEEITEDKEKRSTTKSNGSFAVPRTEIKPVLAVMTFEYRGQEADLADFAKGITESLLVELAYRHDMEILDASMLDAGTTEGQSLADRLRGMGARFVLHGLLQHVQSTVRIYMALTDTSSARRIWTEKFDLPDAANVLLDAQDEITGKIVGRVADEFGLINHTLLMETRNKEPDELGMYEASLRYNAWVWTFDRGDFIKAKIALEHCYELYPNNVMVCALLSDIYSSDYLLAYNMIDDSLDRGLALAQKALNIDPTHQLAQWSLALNYQLRGDLTHINNALEKIFPLSNTNPFLYLTIGIIIGMTKDLAEGKRMVEEALAVNPHSPAWCRIMPFVFYYAEGRYDLALGEALHMNLPTCTWFHLLRAAAYAKLGRKEQAREAVKQLLELEPEFENKRRQILHAMLIDEKWVKMIDDGLIEAGL